MILFVDFSARTKMYFFIQFFANYSFGASSGFGMIQFVEANVRLGIKYSTVQY